MGKARKTRKFAEVKRILSTKDTRLKKEPTKKKITKGKTAGIAKGKAGEEVVKRIPRYSSALFFKHNTALGPPYHVLLDTNFINFAIQNKIDIIKGMMDCLYAKCVPIITDCVMAELEKMGPLFRVALRIARDHRFERLPCSHAHRCYLVATCDRDLKRRIRKIPGVPIMYLSQHRFTVERLPEAMNAPR